jgi:hypothetical protein
MQSKSIDWAGIVHGAPRGNGSHRPNPGLSGNCVATQWPLQQSAADEQGPLVSGLMAWQSQRPAVQL